MPAVDEGAAEANQRRRGPQRPVHYRRGDKRLAFFTLQTLSEYVLIAQDRTRVEVDCRGVHAAPERLERPRDVLRLESLGSTLSLSDLYDKASAADGDGAAAADA